MSKPDIRQNAGRCDYCGKLVEMESGDKLVMTEPTTTEELPEGFTKQEANEALADALERSGGPKDAMLADVIRKDEYEGLTLHKRCEQESELSNLWVDDW